MMQSGHITHREIYVYNIPFHCCCHPLCNFCFVCSSVTVRETKKNNGSHISSTTTSEKKKEEEEEGEKRTYIFDETI